MSYNNGFPTSASYQQVQPIQQVGYNQYNAQPQNVNTNLANNIQQPISQQPVFNQTFDDRIKVQGIDNVKLYPIAPNTIATLWDVDDKTFYRVSAGTPIRVFEYHEVGVDSSQDLNQDNDTNSFNIDEYVKFDDLENIINQIVESKIGNEITKPHTDIDSNTQTRASRTMSKSKGGKS